MVVRQEGAQRQARGHPPQDRAANKQAHSGDLLVGRSAQSLIREGGKLSAPRVQGAYPRKGAKDQGGQEDLDQTAVPVHHERSTERQKRNQGGGESRPQKGKHRRKR